MTLLLIGANVAVFLREATLPAEALESLLRTWGFVPARFFAALQGHPSGPAIASLFTSLFLHAGWAHVLGNCWYLWIFGDNVEDRFGHAGYLAIYLAWGAIAGLAHAFALPGASLPAVGASGAIAGVLGAYLVFYPQGRVLTLLPLVIFFTTVEIRAVWFLLFWFLLQSLSGVTEIATTAGATSGGVAWWAHIGGFVAGAAAAGAWRLLAPAAPRDR